MKRRISPERAAELTGDDKYVKPAEPKKNDDLVNKVNDALTVLIDLVKKSNSPSITVRPEITMPEPKITFTNPVPPIESIRIANVKRTGSGQLDGFDMLIKRTQVH